MSVNSFHSRKINLKLKYFNVIEHHFFLNHNATALCDEYERTFMFLMLK